MTSNLIRIANILLRAAELTSSDELRESLVVEAVDVSSGVHAPGQLEGFCIDNIDPDGVGWTLRTELWRRYVSYCERKQATPISKHFFYDYLRRNYGETKYIGNWYFKCALTEEVPLEGGSKAKEDDND